MTTDNMPPLPEPDYTTGTGGIYWRDFSMRAYASAYAEQQTGMAKILLADVLANIEGLNLARFEELRPRIKDFLK